MFKKTLTVLLASLLALTVFAGCDKGDEGGTTSATSADTTPATTAGTTPAATTGSSGNTDPATQTKRYYVPTKLSGGGLDMVFVWGENSLEIQNDADSGGTVRIVFDSKGNILEEEKGGYHDKYEYEYDDRGNLTKLIVKMKRGGEFSEVGRTVYEYDGNGRKTKAEHFFELGEGDHGFIFYEYNDKGKLIKETRSNESDMQSYTSYTEYAYDANGNLIKQTHHYSDDDRTHSNEYEYDANGNMVKWAQNVDPSGIAIVFEYDSNGNISKMSQELDGTEHQATFEWIEGTEAQYRVYLAGDYSFHFDPN